MGFVAFEQPSSPYKTSVDRPRLLLFPLSTQEAALVSISDLAEEL
jgi:hypothetical protein